LTLLQIRKKEKGDETKHSFQCRRFQTRKKESQAKKLLASSFLNFNRKKKREHEKRSSLMSSVMDTTKKGSNKRRDFIRLLQQQKRRKHAPLSEPQAMQTTKQTTKTPEREREKKVARETRRLGQVNNIFTSDPSHLPISYYLPTKQIHGKVNY